MDKKEFLVLVGQTIKLNPEWLDETISAIQSGVAARLDHERTLRANAETALCMCYDASKDKLPPAHDTIVKKALANSGMFAGTGFAEKLEMEIKSV